ncbi:hypothetical protein LshimejAT787_1601830 [Lyophyllum shimeji]|uniref:Ndc10 domain-containing protein n=1 Tax=Lyophyllum shimeji TaxID=47721 RepID=A0A9P3PZ77_LYOSH|nr:hypothetical protein LshimejAT787_1601830 [Lyophyllum shimeji]
MSGPHNIPIDPALLNGDSVPVNNSNIEHDRLKPATDAHGNVLTPYGDFKAILAKEKRKQPLRDACLSLSIPVASRANLEVLRDAIVKHWFPHLPLQAQLAQQPPPARKMPPFIPTTPSSAASAMQSRATPTPMTNAARESTTSAARTGPSGDDDESVLIGEFGIEGANADELLGYDDDDDEGEDEWDGCTPDADDEGEGEDLDAYKIRIRVDATRRAEGNRRAGGLKTQRAMVRAWEEFVEQALSKKQICDEIVDEHSLLVFITFCAERPKRTRRGIDIPGTFVGASQLKKMFFGALRIRKEQDAADPSLARRRPATSVIVWDAIKNRMDEACERVRNGLVPAEDAPDIQANTFLVEITEEQLDAVGIGFLQHRELRSVIYGYLAWTAQNASGNRGDDFRALKLAELQSWTMLHPNKETAIYSVLGLQGEEKAGKRGMKTKINPVYSVFIAHHRPERCPLGAFAFYHHYLHDVKHLTESMNIDWSWNKSWRAVRVLSGPKLPTTPFSDQSLYNLYVKAFAAAGFKSPKTAVHLPRRTLGYRQEAMGVDPTETAKMGWVRGETYFDTYRPAIPKTAVLGAHGYKAHEIYDPVWRHVHVPEVFLMRVCPDAEAIHSDVVGRENLSGAANYWSMVITLRPYLFQCRAALYELYPKSALFKLPAFTSPDVKNWMTTRFRTDLMMLRANAGSPVDLQRIQNHTLQLALEEVRTLLAMQVSMMTKHFQQQERRTAVLSPTKGFSQEVYHATGSTSTALNRTADTVEMSMVHFSEHVRSDSGVYTADDSTLRAFVNASPAAVNAPRERTQVDLVLPPAAAFCHPGALQLIWPPVLGQKGVRWSDIFPLVKQPHLLWECWKPSKSLDQFSSVNEIWDCYVLGEPVLNDAGGPSQQKKAWERFREIPEWIDKQSDSRGVAPQVIIDELEQMRGGDKQRKGLNALMKDIQKLRKDKAREQRQDTVNVSALSCQPAIPPVLPLLMMPPSSCSRTSPLQANATLLQSQFREVGRTVALIPEVSSVERSESGARKRAIAVDARVRAKKMRYL